MRFFARSLRRPPDEDGGLELPPSRHRATPTIPGIPTKHIRRGFVSRFALVLWAHGAEPTTARRRLAVLFGLSATSGASAVEGRQRLKWLCPLR